MSRLTEDRRRAIEQSGFGEEFHLVQPQNLAFWVYCLLVIAGAVVLSGQISIAAAAYSGALISGTIAFGLLAVAYLSFIHYEDRYTTVPPKLAAAGFVWGAVAAIGAFALLGNDAVMNLYAKTFGANFAFDWGAALTAPVNEELAEGAGMLLLLTLAPRLIRSPFDGLVVGTLVGLGFQISEDVSYAFIGAANAFGDVDAAWATIFARTLASIPSHWMFSGLIGAGLVWFIGRPEVPARKGLGAALMLTAMLMHGLWNASSAIGGGSAFAWIVPTTVPACSSACSSGSTRPPCRSSANGCARSWPPRSSSASSRRPSSTRSRDRARRSSATSARSRAAAGPSACSRPSESWRTRSHATVALRPPLFSMPAAAVARARAA